jgi:hypothetical protein
MGAVSSGKGKPREWRSSKRCRKFAFVQGQARIAGMGFLVRKSPGLMCMRASLRSGFSIIRRKLSETRASSRESDGWEIDSHVPASSLPRPWRGTWGKAGAPIGPFLVAPLAMDALHSTGVRAFHGCLPHQQSKARHPKFKLLFPRTRQRPTGGSTITTQRFHSDNYGQVRSFVLTAVSEFEVRPGEVGLPWSTVALGYQMHAHATLEESGHGFVLFCSDDAASRLTPLPVLSFSLASDASRFRITPSFMTVRAKTI